jgi:hypothetical protein
LALTALSCAQNTSQPTINPPPASASFAQPQPADAPVIPNIPKDARWTISCAPIDGPDHAARARVFRDQLIQASGLHDWYLLQGDRQTTLYYGYYRAIHDDKDPTESARAQADRKAISQLTNRSNGERLFSSVVFVTLEGADPAAPPEWNLANVDGDYSLQVGVYKDSPIRKERAVQAVREARALGYDAYYYHGPTSSSVCIGVWPASAFKQQNDFKAKNPNGVLLAAPGQLPLPEGELMTNDGKPIDVMQAKIDILDEKLRATLRAFPNHSINGEDAQAMKNPRTGQVHVKTRSPFLVRIPRGQSVARPVAGNADVIPGPIASPAQAPTIHPPVAPAQQPKGGKLRSIED